MEILNDNEILFIKTGLLEVLRKLIIEDKKEDIEVVNNLFKKFKSEE